MGTARYEHVDESRVNLQINPIGKMAAHLRCVLFIARTSRHNPSIALRQLVGDRVQAIDKCKDSGDADSSSERSDGA